jgi:hypothetical protein
MRECDALPRCRSPRRWGFSLRISTSKVPGPIQKNDRRNRVSATAQVKGGDLERPAIKKIR